MKQIASILLSGAFACTAAFAAPVSLPDPGFEQSAEGKLAGWEAGAWGPKGVPRSNGKVVEGVAHSGRKSFRLHNEHFQTVAWLELPVKMAVKPGARYLFTAWLRPETAMSPEGIARVQVMFFDENDRGIAAGAKEGELIDGPIPVQPQNSNASVRNSTLSINQDFSGFRDGWFRAGYAFTVPERAKSMQLRFALVGEGDLYIDDISLEENGTAIPQLPAGLWRNGTAALESREDGGNVVRFRLRNTLDRAVGKLRFGVASPAGEAGQLSDAGSLAPGEEKEFEIPVVFPPEYSSPNARLVIDAGYELDGGARKEQWLLFAPVKPRWLEEAVRLDRWGAIDKVPGGDAELAGSFVSENGRRRFSGRGDAMKLTPESCDYSFVLKFDGNPAKSERVDLDWECLDYYWRPESGKLSFTIPAGKSYLARIPLSEKQFGRLRQTLFESGSGFYRLTFRVSRNGGKPVEQVCDLVFERPPEADGKLPPLPPKQVDIPVFGKLKLVDEVLCGDPNDPHPLRQGAKGLMAKYSSEPLGYYGGSDRLNYDWQNDYRDHRDDFSRIETLLGEPCRVTADNGWFAYKMGRGQLVSGKYYLLEIEYPEDVSRNFLISNRQYTRGNFGFSTGSALWDSPNRQRFMQKFDLPLSQIFQKQRTIMYAVRDTDWIGIHTLGRRSSPFSAGAAVHAIRLYEIGGEAELGKFALEAEEPEGLPRRLAGFLNEDLTPEPDAPVRYRIYGFNCFAPLTLSYCGTALARSVGNDGGVRFPSRLFGPDGLRNPMALKHPGYYHLEPHFLERFLRLGSEQKLAVFPVLEYAGTGQFPPEAFAVNPDGTPVVYRWGSAGGPGGVRVANKFKDGLAIDMAHPAVGEDMAKLVTELADRYPDLGGIVLTLRFQAWQVGFGRETLERFARDCNVKLPEKDAGKYVCRHHLRRFMSWYFERKRENFLTAAAALHARHPEMKLFILNYNNGDDNLSFGNPLYLQGAKKADFVAPGGVAFPDLSNVDLVKQMEDYTRHENREMSIGMNPPLYNNDRNLWNLAPVRYPYTTGNAGFLDKFRTGEGSALCFWGLYNEDTVGYDTFVNVPAALHGGEAAGRYSMLDQVLSMAAADPFVMFFRGGECNFGYAEPVREFMKAYRALPALPSQVIRTASDPGVVIRRCDTPKGVYLAVINTGLAEKPAKVTIPAEGLGGGTLRNLSTGERLKAADGAFATTALPVSLQAFKVEP